MSTSVAAAAGSHRGRLIFGWCHVPCRDEVGSGVQVVPSPQDTDRILSARGISKSFGGVAALRDVSFDIRPGEVHALVGENGAGKSTLIKIIAGAVTPDAGEVV